jgi:hypothetical protein
MNGVTIDLRSLDWLSDEYLADLLSAIQTEIARRAPAAPRRPVLFHQHAPPSAPLTMLPPTPSELASLGAQQHAEAARPGMTGEPSRPVQWPNPGQSAYSPVK